QDLAGNSATLTLPATGTDGLAAKDLFAGLLADEFESGNFSALPWQLSYTGVSPANWTVESSQVQSGNYAAQSGAIGASGTSTLSITAIGPAGELSFWRMVPALPGPPSGTLSFDIDGVAAGQWGAVGWQQSYYYVTAGQHTFSWTYANGAGAAYLDNVLFAPGKTLT